MSKKKKIIISVPLKSIKEVGLEEIVISSLWFSRDFPQVFFTEIDGKKILFTAGATVDSKILDNGNHLIFRTIEEVFFTFVEKYEKFIFLDPNSYKLEYKSNSDNLPHTIKILVIKCFSPFDEIIVRAIKKKIKKQQSQ